MHKRVKVFVYIVIFLVASLVLLNASLKQFFFKAEINEDYTIIRYESENYKLMDYTPNDLTKLKEFEALHVKTMPIFELICCDSCTLYIDDYGKKYIYLLTDNNYQESDMLYYQQE